MGTASSGSLARIYGWQDEFAVEDVEVEDPNDYCPGGFHPVLLDDTYHDDRYRVVHKLGFGSCSTVWLARDRLANKYVSLKFLEAEASQHSREAQMLNHIARESKGHQGNKFFPSLLEEFTLTGPNGDHKCLVTEALGPTVLQVKESYRGDLLPLNIAKRVTVQLALGLASVHSCGVIHGDMYVNNIAFKTEDFRSWPLSRLYERLGSPVKHVVIRKDSNNVGPEAPPYGVPTAMLLDLMGPSVGDISVLDFGAASFASEPREGWHTPIALQAPEALLDMPVGQPADIWAFACTVFELFGNESIVEGCMLTADDVLDEIADTLGPPPPHWRGKWEQRGLYSGERIKSTDNMTEYYHETRPLAVRMRRMRSKPPIAREAEQLSEKDIVGLENLLERCLKYEPEERATAADILNLEWIREISEKELKM